MAKEMRTKSAELQASLQGWADEASKCLALPHPSSERSTAILVLARSFVPIDNIEEEDIIHFAGNLTSDDEFFASFVREIQQCASGQGVEKIEGDQKSRAVFTLLPPQGTVSEGSALDIVREVAFVNTNGQGWRAEG
jgi:hypothetical protein